MWEPIWVPLAALGLGLGLGGLMYVLTAPRRPPPPANPWAQRTTRDWDPDKHGSALDGAGGHWRWRYRQGSDE